MLALLALLTLGGGGIQVQTGVRVEFTDCAAAGSSSQSIPDGTYLMRVTGEDSFLCYAGTCASPNGEKYPLGTVMLLKVCSAKFCDGAGTTASCRSAGSTGDIILTRAEPVN